LLAACRQHLFARNPKGKRFPSLGKLPRLTVWQPVLPQKKLQRVRIAAKPDAKSKPKNRHQRSVNCRYYREEHEAREDLHGPLRFVFPS
jgi:hypothetical protein